MEALDELSLDPVSSLLEHDVIYCVLKLVTGEEHDDIYEFVARHVIASGADRHKIKLGLLSTLYGAKNKTVKNISSVIL